MTSELVPLLKAAEFFPAGRDGKKKHINCIRRYAAGLKNGAKLETRKVGPLVYTTREWVDQFITDCSSRTDPKLEPRVNEDAIVRRLKAKGVFGAEAKNEVLGLRRAGKNSRSVSSVSPGRSLRSENRCRDGSRVDCEKDAATKEREAAQRLPITAGAATESRE